MNLESLPRLAQADWNAWIDWLQEQVTLGQVVYHNTVRQWLIALGTAVAVFLVLRIVKAFIAKRAAKFVKGTEIGWDDAVAEVLAATKSWFLLVVGLYVGSLFLYFPDDTRVRALVERATIIVLILQGVVWGGALLKFFLEHKREQRIERDPASATTMAALGFLGRVMLWSLALLLILDNLGVDVTALVAGLGVGGIAVALAAQNILGDLFASMSIVLDKPFVLGDFVIVGDLMGNVEKIGLKTTRLRSLSGEQLVFSNNDLLQSRIRNYKRMQERRIAFGFGVTYDTPIEKLEAIPELVRKIVEEATSPGYPTQTEEQTRFDRCHFKEYGDSSLNFEVVYYVLVPDYNVYMDLQQAMNLALFREFAAREIEFAFPTRTVYLERGNEATGP